MLETQKENKAINKIMLIFFKTSCFLFCLHNGVSLKYLHVSKDNEFLNAAHV